MKRMILVCSVVGVALTMSSPTLADVTITTATTIRVMGVPVMNDYSTEMIKGRSSRSSAIDSAEITGMTLPGQRKEKGITVVRLDEDRQWTLFEDDTTYEESSVSPVSATISPLVSDQQSLDSSFVSDTKSIVWQIDSTSLAPDTVLGIPCIAYRSAISAVAGKNDVDSDARCTFWVATPEDFDTEYVDYYEAYGEIKHHDYDWFALYDAFLSTFSITRQDLGIDSLIGIPVKVEMSFMGALGSGVDFDAAAQADAFAEDMVAEDVLVDEAARAAEDSAAADPDFKAVDSLADTYKRFFLAATANMKAGTFEMFGLSAQIIDIDTTALPDSLFDIPPGYTRR